MEKPIHTIQIVASEPPPSIEQQIRIAVYDACIYHRPTKITSGTHQVAYVISEHMLNDLLRRLGKETL